LRWLSTRDNVRSGYIEYGSFRVYKLESFHKSYPNLGAGTAIGREVETNIGSSSPKGEAPVPEAGPIAGGRVPT
jgi:hypothetical protein